MIFVTGGTGLIGAHLLLNLVKSGKKVKALKRNTSDLNITLKIFSYYSSDYENLFSQIDWVNGDILDYFSLENLLADVDIVYHCAAIVSFRSSDRKKMIANNVEGTSNIINAAIYNNVKKFCHVSSISALGKNNNNDFITEATSWVPSKKNSGYSESKFFSEAEVWRGIQEGLDCIIVNPSIVLGPGNWNSGSSKLFKTINDGLQFYTKGVTGYVDVRDVVNAMILLTENDNFKNCKNQRFILNSENRSYLDIFNSIADELNKKRPRFYTPDIFLGIIWRIATLGSLIIGKKTNLTRDAVTNSNSKSYFDGNKIIQQINGFKYREVSQSIKEISEILRSESN